MGRITKSKEMERWIDTFSYFLKGNAKRARAFNEAALLWRETGQVKGLYYFCYEIRWWSPKGKIKGITTNDENVLFLSEVFRQFLAQYWTLGRLHKSSGRDKNEARN